MKGQPHFIHLLNLELEGMCLKIKIKISLNLDGTIDCFVKNSRSLTQSGYAKEHISFMMSQ